MEGQDQDNGHDQLQDQDQQQQEAQDECNQNNEQELDPGQNPVQDDVHTIEGQQPPIREEGLPFSSPLENEDPGSLLMNSTTLKHLAQRSNASRRMPYLDVLSIQSTRLLSMTRKKLDEQVALRKQKLLEQTGKELSPDFNKLLDLNELLSSVHLLLEPVQIPDLAHTGINLTSTKKEPYNPQRHGLALEMDTRLFYPNGAKNTDIGEYITQVLQHSHSVAGGGLDGNVQAPGANTSTITPSKRGIKPGEKTLSMSCSAPTLKQLSPLKKKPHKTKKHQPENGVAGATGAGPSLTSFRRPSPLLNPELEKQARQVLAGLRANSTKIGDLINS